MPIRVSVGTSIAIALLLRQPLIVHRLYVPFSYLIRAPISKTRNSVERIESIAARIRRDLLADEELSFTVPLYVGAVAGSNLRDVRQTLLVVSHESDQWCASFCGGPFDGMPIACSATLIEVVQAIKQVNMWINQKPGARLLVIHQKQFIKKEKAILNNGEEDAA